MHPLLVLGRNKWASLTSRQPACCAVQVAAVARKTGKTEDGDVVQKGPNRLGVLARYRRTGRPDTPNQSVNNIE